MITIKDTAILHITDGDRFHYGANQIWYRNLLQRKAGCGPTCAAHLIWYFASARPEYSGLVTRDCRDKAGFRGLMEDTWRYVTPGFGGVNKLSVFTEGVIRYGRERGFSLGCSVLEVPANPEERPTNTQFFDFLEKHIRRDEPVAFLNLNNGGVAGLDTWHWVTLVGVDREAGTALMYDQNRRLVIDIRRWLSATTDRGGLVALTKAS